MHIYKFTHIETGRCYIGQTIRSTNLRRLEHLSRSRTSPKNSHLHNAIHKYGVDAFTFEVMTCASSLEQLNMLEEMLSNVYDSIANGFNIRPPGDNKRHSAETIKKMSESQKEAHKLRRLNGTEGGWVRVDGGAMLGKTQSEKQKEVMRNYNKHKIITDEIRQNMKNSSKKGMSWKIVDGKRLWVSKE